MNTSNNPAWERTKARGMIAIGTTMIDACICSDYTTKFLTHRFVENTKTIINNDDQAIPDLFKSFMD